MSEGRGPTNAERTEALEALLLEHGFIQPGDIDRVVDRFQNDVGPMVGATAVARAWTDPDFRDALLADGKVALADFGVRLGEAEHVVVVENTAEVHNVVVCTLCSCYPWDLLGLPPAWYKDPAYRSRVVREPRAVLSEMGLDVGPGVEIRVWDSSAEVRYLVIPERPPGTDGLGVDQLIPLVNRDSMIGVARADAP